MFRKLNLPCSSSSNNSKTGYGSGGATIDQSNLLQHSCSTVRVSAIVFLILIENVSHIGGYANPYTTTRAAQFADTHRLAKRMNLESCLGQFDVHKNTIIRTGESQAIGGKYLQGIELDTMEECQRLCCETESCDVYIFEDKNGGYCYLFECGSPENFHCKFTRHANYTSAVLTTVRHVPEVTTTHPSLPHFNTTNISQQEWELSNLKLKPETRDKNVEVAASGGALNSVAGEPQVYQSEQGISKKAANTSALCGRFQFTCHSGECIAVYNACDGIPQCVDGSDEGPECSGATSSSSITSMKGNVQPASVNILDRAMQKATSMPQYQSSLMIQQTAQQQLQSMQQQQQQFQQQQSEPRLMPTLINNREDAAAWANRKIMAETQQLDATNTSDFDSRIFNHKGGMQLPSSSIVSNYANRNANVNPLSSATLQRSGIYLPHAADMAGSMFPPAQQQQQIMQTSGIPTHIIIPPNLNWPQQNQKQSAVTAISPVAVKLSQGPAYIINSQQTVPQLLQPAQAKPLLPLESEGLAVPVVAQQTLPQPQPSVAAMPAAGMPSPLLAPVENKTNKESQKEPGPAANSLVVHEDYEDYEEKSTEPPKKKQRKYKKVKSKPRETKKLSKPKSPIEISFEQQQEQNQNVVAPLPPSPVREQYKMIHENLAMEFRDHDGQSERPGGAVLSLTLGLLVTAALAILIGCRMRTVGSKRARRLGGKTPYSHEADFLVNGMYL